MHTITKEIKRRHFLGGIATLTGAAGTLTAIPAAASTDPLPGYVAEWRAARAIYEQFANDTYFEENGPEDRARFDRMEEAEKRVLNSKPITVAGVAAQIDFAIEMGLVGGVLGADLEDMDGAMFRRMLEAMRGL